MQVDFLEFQNILAFLERKQIPFIFNKRLFIKNNSINDHPIINRLRPRARTSSYLLTISLH